MYFIVNQPLQLHQMSRSRRGIMTQPPGFTTRANSSAYTARKYVLWRPYWYRENGKRWLEATQRVTCG
ncbi:Uncharacterised protein [Escherichia coli]|nr:Uncharacterised protein [Escherichia coli]